MDELLKAITQLINTGGALADDALYLYFAAKMVGYAAIPLTALAALRGLRECIRVGMNASARNTFLQLQLHYAEYDPQNRDHAWAEKRLAEARETYRRG